MLKTAQIQFDPQVGELERNFNKVAELLTKTGNARLVILPELANSGYNFIDREHAFTLATTVEKSDYTNTLLQAFMKRKGMNFSILRCLFRQKVKLTNTGKCTCL